MDENEYKKELTPEEFIEIIKKILFKKYANIFDIDTALYFSNNETTEYIKNINLITNKCFCGNCQKVNNTIITKNYQQNSNDENDNIEITCSVCRNSICSLFGIVYNTKPELSNDNSRKRTIN